MNGFNPDYCSCGYSVKIVDGVYQLTDDPAISIDGEGLKWLGYENIGINYEPGYAIHKKDDFGMFGACSRTLARHLGNEKIVLDLGTGLGQASIPLAVAGINTIAADISQTMLKTQAERAGAYNILSDKLICARMNAYRLMLADSSVDAVVEIDMLHQVDRPELVMDEVLRVLKSDGIYVRYGCKGLPLSDRQTEQNAKSNGIRSDITDYYEQIIQQRGYGSESRPFSSWEQSANAFENKFKLSQIIDSGEISDWEGDVNFVLHKLKTRASGGNQLIPDEIHNYAWAETEAYAKEKFGENFGELKRYQRMEGHITVYTRK